MFLKYSILNKRFISFVRFCTMNILQRMRVKCTVDNDSYKMSMKIVGKFSTHF